MKRDAQSSFVYLKISAIIIPLPRLLNFSFSEKNPEFPQIFHATEQTQIFISIHKKNMKPDKRDLPVYLRMIPLLGPRNGITIYWAPHANLYTLNTLEGVAWKKIHMTLSGNFLTSNMPKELRLDKLLN
jgi:hypothetical protein